MNTGGIRFSPSPQFVKIHERRLNVAHLRARFILTTPLPSTTTSHSMIAETQSSNVKQRGQSRFIQRLFGFKFLWFACVFGCSMPLLSAEAGDRAALHEAQAMLRRLKFGNPGKNTNLLVDYVKGVVDAEPNGRSLAARMSDIGLWGVLEDTGKLIPPGFKSLGSDELAVSLEVLEKEFVSANVAMPQVRDRKYWDTVKVLLERPALKSLSGRVRDSTDAERHWAFIGLARILSSLQKEPVVVELDQSGRRKITPIHQQRNHCVSACGLMALQRMTGVDLPAALQSHLAELSSRSAARGSEGASSGVIYPKVGLDILDVNYAEELESRRAEERMRFAISVLKDRIVPELKVGKLVVLIIDSSPLNHAILLSGVSEDGNIEHIDPAGGKMRVVSADYLAKQWYVQERKALSATIISFPNLPDSRPATAPAKLSLEIPTEAQAALLTKLAIDRDDLTIEKLNTEAKSFRWIDMTERNKDGADPAALGGISLAIQLQLLAGRPVGSLDRKGNRLLFTGYSGPLGGAETSFKVETSEGLKDLTWKEIVKSLTVKGSSSKDTLFLGYLVSEIDPYTLKL